MIKIFLSKGAPQDYLQIMDTFHKEKCSNPGVCSFKFMGERGETKHYHGTTNLICMKRFWLLFLYTNICIGLQIRGLNITN